MARKVPDLLVERLAAGDLPPQQAAQVRAQLEQEAGGLQRLGAIRLSDARTLAEHPPERVAAEVARRARPAPESRRWLAIPALAMAALALFLLRRPGHEPQRGQVLADPGEDRVKGLEPRVVVYRQTPHGIEALGPQAVVHPGDLLQPAYVAAGHRQGALVSLDGRGGVTLHADHLEPDGERKAPQAFELDDAPDFERFLLVVSDEPMDSAAILAAARRLAASGQARTGRLGLPHTREASLLLRKGPR